MMNSNSLASSSDVIRDAQVIKGLFAALCTSIPDDVRIELLQTSSLELKFLTAVQPRVSSFSHRRRHSLRHPAISMAVQRFYWAQRMRRMAQEMEALQRQGDGSEDGKDGGVAAEADRINALLSSYASRGGGDLASDASGNVPEDGGWGDLGSSVAGSLWHYRRVSAAGGPGSISGGLDDDELSGGGFTRQRSASAGSAGIGAQMAAARRPSAVSESLRSVIMNTGHYAYLLDLPDGSGGRGGRRPNASQGGSGRRGSVGGDSSLSGITNTPDSFFFSKYRQRQVGGEAAASGGKKKAGKRGKRGKRDGHAPMGMAAELLISRDADDMEDEEEFVAFQQAEDARWEKIAACYDQMLRAASAPCRVAARGAAANAALNDIIRRFWDRMTVSPAAQERYEAQVSQREGQAGRGGGADGSPDGDGSTRDGTSDAGSDGRAGAGGRARGKRRPAGLRGRGSGRGSGGADGATKGRSSSVSPGGAGAAGGKKKAAAGGKTRAASTASCAGGTSLYMSPLQYVYLHMRIVGVLLPPGNDLEMEMLESVREDLLMDSVYREDDPRIEHYFGRGPSLLMPPGVASQKNPNPPEEIIMAPASGLTRTRCGRAQPGSRSRPFRSSESAIGDGAESVGANSMIIGAATTIARPDLGYMVRADVWNPARMPWLTFPQFWCSMMELVDNWTCSAANPVEGTVFLFELYGEVFGHDWSSEDEAYFNMLKKKHSAAAAKADRTKESQAVLDSFHNMLDLLDEMSESDSAIFMETHFGPVETDEEPAAATPPRRRSTKRYPDGIDGAAEGAAGGSDDELDENGIDWSGKRKIDGWRYRKIFNEETGVWERRRRKMVLERSRSARRSAEEKRKAGEGGEGGEEVDSNEAGMDTDSSQYSVYIIEEDLDSDNEVTARRRLHRHRKTSKDAGDDEGGDGKGAGRRRRRLSDSDDLFMYETRIVEEDDDVRREYKYRLYYDEPSRQYRRLEDGSRRDDNIDHFDDNLSAATSWSSFADRSDADSSEGWQLFRPLETEEERAKRRRRRVRRTGLRAERRRYGREADYFHRKDYGSGSDDDDDWDRRDRGMETTLEFSDHSYSITDEQDLRPLRATEEELSTEQRAHLLSKKEWLQRMLATKGVHISDAAFENREEEAVLYQLLLMTERLAAKAAAAGVRFEDAEDIGIADFDAALMAKLFAKPKTYTLEELQQSELMKMLLGMDDGTDAGGQQFTAAQMDGILAALMSKAPRDPPEQASARRRRERLLAEAKALQKMLKEQERQRRHEERAAERERRRAEAEANGTFGLTEVAEPGEGGDGKDKKPAPVRRRPPPVPSQTPTGDDVDDGQLVHMQSRGATPALSRPTTSGAAALQRPVTSGDAGLSADDLAEQEKLFREFELYCAEYANRTSKYKVSFVEYTPEQLEAFFVHLNLGQKQRALLLGRAPLAAPTSTIGGTYHQDRHRQGQFALGADFLAAGGGRDARPTAPAPVKVFTLTTATSMEGAVKESYRSYMEDRAYLAAITRQQQQQQQRGQGLQGQGQGLQGGSPLSRARAGLRLPPLSEAAIAGRGHYPHPPRPRPSINRGRRLTGRNSTSDAAGGEGEGDGPVAGDTAVTTAMLAQRAMDALDALEEAVDAPSADAPSASAAASASTAAKAKRKAGRGRKSSPAPGGASLADRPSSQAMSYTSASSRGLNISDGDGV